MNKILLQILTVVATIIVVCTLLSVVDYVSHPAKHAVEAISNGIYYSPIRKTSGFFEYQTNAEAVKLEERDSSRAYYRETRYDPSPAYLCEVGRANCMSNLSKIAIAMRNYAKSHEGRLPPAYTTDAEGKPLHSWRVLLLPYFHGADGTLTYLYQQIRLNEPWDSEWNRQFFDCLPHVYYCAGDDARTQNLNLLPKGVSPSSLTYYSVVVGENTAFPRPTASTTEDGGLRAGPTLSESNAAKALKDRYRDLPLGSSERIPEKERQAEAILAEKPLNAMLVVERADPVCWMKPDAELTVEELADGSFLQKVQEASRHVDKTGRPNIPLVGFSEPYWAPFNSSKNEAYWLCILNETVTPEQIAELASRTPNPDLFRNYRKRFVSFL